MYHFIMRRRHKLVMQFPGRLSYCSAVKVLFLVLTSILLLLFVQNMFYVIYAKFNGNEIRLVHLSSWKEKPARMVEFDQIQTSSVNETLQETYYLQYMIYTIDSL